MKENRQEAKEEPINFSCNKFKDKKSIGRDDAKVDKILTKGLQKSVRDRASGLIDLTCNKCKKTYNVSPLYLGGGFGIEDYVCDQCAKRGA